ncbi:hypothetical protein BJX96DRAFT_165918 [Aspergillus floccosus]
MEQIDPDILPAQSEAAYSCSVCSTNFDNPEQMQKHEKTHKKKSFPCSKCDKAFSRRKNRASRTGASLGPFRVGHGVTDLPLPTSASGPSVTTASSTVLIGDGQMDLVLEETMRELHSPRTLLAHWNFISESGPSAYSTPSADRRMQHEGMYNGESLDQLELTETDDILQSELTDGPDSRLPDISRNSPKMTDHLPSIQSRSSSEAPNSGDESPPSDAPSDSFTAEPGSYEFIFKPLQPSPFPPVEDLRLYMQLFFHYFHPILPIIHRPSFNANKCHWVLVLAIAAVGSQYVGSTKTSLHQFPIGEYLRRALIYELERGGIDCQSRTWLIQSMTLSQAHSVTSGEGSIRPGVGWAHLNLVDLFSPGATLACFFQLSASCEVNGAAWADWIAMETVRRAGYAIMIEDLGEFSSVLVLHALLEETWSVQRYFQRPLSSWVPSSHRPAPAARPQSLDDTYTVDDEESPQRRALRIPLFSKWRDAACDCFDALHWEANSICAKNAGIEHPAVLHLHLARIIILVPYAQIRLLADYIAAHGTCPTSVPDTVRVAEREIYAWLRHDQFRARLAVVHAGALFWHIRRYSIGAFYEPLALFLASLTLWAYGSYAAHITGHNGQFASADNGDTHFLRRTPTNNDILFPSLFPALRSSSLAQPPMLRATDAGDQLGSSPQAMEAAQNPSASPIRPACTPQDDALCHQPEATETAAQGPRHAFSQCRPSDTAIILDRPIDDEMVQLWVAEGIPQRITAFMFGSVDICALPHGPTRVLSEGSRLLQAPVMCRSSDAYSLILAKMVAFMKSP